MLRQRLLPNYWVRSLCMASSHLGWTLPGKALVAVRPANMVQGFYGSILARLFVEPGTIMELQKILTPRSLAMATLHMIVPLGSTGMPMHRPDLVRLEQGAGIPASAAAVSFPALVRSPWHRTHYGDHLPLHGIDFFLNLALRRPDGASVC